MSDLIDRQDAIDTHCAICPDKDKCPDGDFTCPDRELFRMIKPAYPDWDESCEDCPLYDKEKHNCPRFCRVIPKAMKELKQPKSGKWINDRGLYKCSRCKQYWAVWWAVSMPIERMCKEMPYCPKCGSYNGE